MVNKYKFFHNENSRLFFTSDSHFFHAKLLAQRGFASVQEHNETLIKNWNSVVRPQDTVIHLGDFILGAGENSEKFAIEIFNRLNGKIFYVWGNHSAGVKSIYKKEIHQQFPSIPDGLEIYPLTWNDKVTFAGFQMLAHIVTPKDEKVPNKQCNHFVFCSHFAHRIWIDGNKGVTNACAHSHSSDKESNPDYKFAKRLDVGVDNFNFTPLDFDKYLAIMQTKQHTILDHHTAEINPSF